VPRGNPSSTGNNLLLVDRLIMERRVALHINFIALIRAKCSEISLKIPISKSPHQFGDTMVQRIKLCNSNWNDRFSLHNGAFEREVHCLSLLDALGAVSSVHNVNNVVRNDFLQWPKPHVQHQLGVIMCGIVGIVP
jgi:hypothetical protein